MTLQTFLGGTYGNIRTCIGHEFVNPVFRINNPLIHLIYLLLSMWRGVSSSVFVKYKVMTKREQSFCISRLTRRKRHGHPSVQIFRHCTKRSEGKKKRWHSLNNSRSQNPLYLTGRPRLTSLGHFKTCVRYCSTKCPYLQSSRSGTGCVSVFGVRWVRGLRGSSWSRHVRGAYPLLVLDTRRFQTTTRNPSESWRPFTSGGKVHEPLPSVLS